MLISKELPKLFVSKHQLLNLMFLSLTTFEVPSLNATEVPSLNSYSSIDSSSHEIAKEMSAAIL